MYDSMAEVQKSVAARLMEMLPQAPPGRILEIGCGSGQLTRLLVEAFGESEIDAIDDSAEMIAHAKRWTLAPVRWHVADLREYRPQRPYSWVVSNSALHWILPVADAIAGLPALLEEGGLVCFSIMLKGTFGELQAARRRAVPAKVPRASLPTGGEVYAALEAAGLECEQGCQQDLVLRFPSARSFLESIRAQGLTGGDFAASQRALHRGELRELLARYQADFGDDAGTVPATYRPLYVRARRARA